MLFIPRERGQSLVEYIAILVFVTLIIALILALLAPSIAHVFGLILAGF